MAIKPHPAYEGDDPFVFVSYSHADENEVYPEIRWLQDQGIEVWFDEGISGATRWRDAIASRLGACRLMVFYVSENSVASQVCREELEFALDRGTPILAVHLEPTELPDGVRLAIANRQALLRDQLEPEDYARKLLTAVSTHLDRPAPDAPLGSTPWKKTRRLSLGAALALVALATVLTAAVTRTVSRGGAENASAPPSTPGVTGVVRFSIPLREAGEVRYGDCFNKQEPRHLGRYPEAGEVRYGDCFNKQEPRHLGRYPTNALAFSNDGTMLVFAGRDLETDTQRLYLRRFDSGEARPIPGTEGGYGPSFYPDDRSIGFFDGQYGKVVPIAGGPAQIVAGPTPQAICYPVDWTITDSAMYARGFDDTLVRLDVSGTEIVARVDPENGDRFFFGFHALPGGKTLLLHRLPRDWNPENAAIFALDTDTGESARLMTDAMNPFYLARTGHLLFMRRGNLMAVGFDPETLDLAGEPFVAHPGIMQDVGTSNTQRYTGAEQLAVSAAGHLAYIAGGTRPERLGSLVKVGPTGEAAPFLDLGERSFHQVRISPDGNRLLFTEWAKGLGFTLHIHDIGRNVTREIDTPGFGNPWAAWSPDGTHIAFSSTGEDGILNVYTVSAEGDEQARREFPSSSPQSVADWAPDRSILFLQDGDIWRLPPGGDAQPLFTTDAFERFASVSPDGEWLAYSSSDSTGTRVYVRPFPGPGSATLVSDRGHSPSWSHDGSRIH
ncbi:MAG: TIR domain-containing protein [Gammaproteobacteria bacterium]